MTPAICKGILNHLHNRQAKVLWVSAAEEDLPDALNATYCPPETSALEGHENRRFDYAVLADLPGKMSKADAEALLARMRDINAQRVFWVLGDEAPWDSHDAIAFGFRQLQKDEHAVLYGFDIENYKTTPDWLNAKYWAHPERWDKERW